SLLKSLSLLRGESSTHKQPQAPPLLQSAPSESGQSESSAPLSGNCYVRFCCTAAPPPGEALCRTASDSPPDPRPCRSPRPPTAGYPFGIPQKQLPGYPDEASHLKRGPHL